MIGDIYPKHSPVSAYQPSKEVSDLTNIVRRAFTKGVEILSKPWEELNNYSIIERMNKDQRAFNSYVDESVDDPREGWKWRGTRSIARNRAMAMHAHLTASLAVPMAFAQNEAQEEDRRMSGVMWDILEWMAINSDYKPSYILATMGALVNPVTFLGAEFYEIFQKIKEKTEKGYEPKEILDEELSGFKAPVYSADQVLITNAYIQNIQRQPELIKRRYVEYSEARQKWEDHSDWGFVQQGIKTIYSEEEGLFYDIKDDESYSTLVEEATFLCRREDTEVVFINGIYFGEENVENNPVRHRDNRNAPKYNVIPFGYERINEHFFYFKSLMNRVGWDNSLIDAMYENVMNRETIDLYTPIGITGADNVDTQVIFPGSVVAFENPEAEIRPLIPQNRTAGYQALREIEASINEASLSETAQGVLPDPEQKAFTVARAEQNARTILRGAFRSIAESIAQYGQLMTDIALHHLTTAQIDEITGAMSYRPFILQDQMVAGKKVSKKILFDEWLVGKEMTDEEIKRESLKLLEKTKYPDNKEHIYRINPHLFSKMKYLIRIEPDVLMEKNEADEKATAERLYGLLRADPLIEPEFLVRELANVHWRGRADEAIAKQAENIMNREGTRPVRLPAEKKQKVGILA